MRSYINSQLKDVTRATAREKQNCVQKRKSLVEIKFIKNIQVYINRTRDQVHIVCNPSSSVHFAKYIISDTKFTPHKVSSFANGRARL